MEYGPDEQVQAADELDRAVADGYVVLPAWIGDYGVLRDQIRACRAIG